LFDQDTCGGQYTQSVAAPTNAEKIRKTPGSLRMSLQPFATSQKPPDQFDKQRDQLDAHIAMSSH
jgi:hypothetical protein